MEEKTPKMRDDIELHPLQHEGQQMVLVRDPLGLIKEPVVLNQAATSILAMLDGTHNMSDLQFLLTRSQGGLLVTTDQVNQILNQLSSAFLLQDERFEKAKSEIVSSYAALPVRTAFHAGTAYPDNSEELELMLNEILKSAQHETQVAQSAAQLAQSEIAALAVPHIDLKVGARCYGLAYNPIRGAEVDLVIILGTGHSVKGEMFCLTGKDFETPLGRSTTDKNLVEELLAAAGGCILDNDLPHRHEHSIDFQIIFLQHVLAKPNVRVVPILCGSFRSQLEVHNRASEIPCIGDFLRKLQSIIERQTGRCLVVAGVDFSHVGLKFGDQYSGRTLIQESTEHDKALMNRLCAWDAAGFWQESRKVGDRYKVCGFAPLASMLEILPGARGHLLGYEVSHEDATHSAVSFASIAFTRD